MSVPAASILCGSGHLHVTAAEVVGYVVVDLDEKPPAKPKTKGRRENGRFGDGHDGRNTPTAGDASEPWALVTWTKSNMVMRRPSYWPTEDTAEAAAAVFRAEQRPYTVVNVTKSVSNDTNNTIIRETTRRVLAHPYPAERPNLDPLRMSSRGYDGWTRAAARPVSSTFHQ
jgi:hypothetical protein